VNKLKKKIMWIISKLNHNRGFCEMCFSHC